MYHGLWAHAIKSPDRFEALMALLRVLDPATENPGDKLHKVKSFVDDFKLNVLLYISPDSKLPLMNVWSNHDTGLAYSNT